jgi:hypothetical protein
VVALRLARQGYYGGDPERVLQAPSDMVLAAAEYEGFLSDYETAYYDLNRGNSDA